MGNCHCRRQFSHLRKFLFNKLLIEEAFTFCHRKSMRRNVIRSGSGITASSPQYQNNAEKRLLQDR